jgi:peptidyl-prolyl cis-trans isomerase C
MTQFRMTPWLRRTALSVAVLALAACNKGGTQSMVPKVDDKPVPTPVAVVNDQNITRPEFDFFVKQLTQGKGPVELTPEQKDQVLDELISMQLLSTEAAKDGVENDPDVVARLQVARMRLLADAEEQKFLKGKEPTDAELHAEYDEQVGKLDKTEYHARHILIADKDDKGASNKPLAEQIIKKLKGGAKFEDLAKQYSIDTGTKAKGGDLGWFAPGRMVKPFSDAVAGLKKGDITPEPVETQFGWHIIQLEDTRDASPPPFDNVKEQVKKIVLQKQFQAYLDSLKKTAKIEKKL